MYHPPTCSPLFCTSAFSDFYSESDETGAQTRRSSPRNDDTVRHKLGILQEKLTTEISSDPATGCASVEGVLWLRLYASLQLFHIDPDTC